MRKIAVVTGTRAEYGLLYWTMKAIDADPELQLQLIATGAHLSPEFGLTYQQIEQDGFCIAEKVEMLLSSDTATGMTKSLGLAVIGFADALARLQPDILVLLGDRYEILAAAEAALLAKIPVAHISGGEITQGAVDDSIRHSITKMAHLHFPEAEEYKKRLIQLGEQPENIFLVGTLCWENIKKMKLLSLTELRNQLNFSWGKKNFLITYHPETLGKDREEDNIDCLLAALDDFSEVNLIFTKSNADNNGRIINQKIENYCKQRKNCNIYTSLGALRYLSLLQYIDAVIGNSSSGLVEVPFFYKPTINIGNRQRGRLKAESVLNCAIDKEAIIKTINLALSENFQYKIKQVKSLYQTGSASQVIVEVLKKCDLNNLLQKHFYDMELIK